MPKIILQIWNRQVLCNLSESRLNKIVLNLFEAMWKGVSRHYKVYQKSQQTCHEINEVLIWHFIHVCK